MPNPLSLICKISGHNVDRARCWHDQMNWRSNCKTCGAGLIRSIDGWREFLPSDYSNNRLSKDEAILESAKDRAAVNAAAKPKPQAARGIDPGRPPGPL